MQSISPPPTQYSNSSVSSGLYSTQNHFFLNTDFIEYCEAYNEYLIAFIHSKNICELPFGAPWDKAVKPCHRRA